MPRADDLINQLLRITSPDILSDDPTPTTEIGIQELNHDKRRIENKRNKTLLKSLKQDIKERKAYASRIYQMLAFWLMFTGAVISFCSIGKIHLSDNVLIALLTTSSANVITIFIYVVKYLFNSNSR